MERNYLQRLAIGAQSDIDVVVGVDDTSTTAISPAMFEACNLALTDERAEAAHAAGKLYFHHSCGHIRDLLPAVPADRDGRRARLHDPAGRQRDRGRGSEGAGRPHHDHGRRVAAGGPDGRPRGRAREHPPDDPARPSPGITSSWVSPPTRTAPWNRRQFVVDCCRKEGGYPR